MPALPNLTRSFCAAPAVCCAAMILFSASPAHAQIKEPGQHPKYTVELEPHLVVQWEYKYSNDSDGIGVGGRVSIPVVDNGPITTINNSLAVGFGLDWAHFGGDCNGVINGIAYARGYDCDANHFFIPAVAQWNFFFTPVVSAFAELGFAVQHASTEAGCINNSCGISDSRTWVRPVFLVGPRFILSDTFAITLRIGVPYLTIGGSFLL